MPDTDTHLDGPAAEEAPEPVRKRHPAELYTLLTGIVVIAVALGLDLTEEQLLAGLAVVTGLPSAITYVVGTWRDALRDLGD